MNFRISDLIFRRKVLPRRDASYATQYSKGENKASPHTTIKANKKSAVNVIETNKFKSVIVNSNS